MTNISKLIRKMQKAKSEPMKTEQPGTECLLAMLPRESTPAMERAGADTFGGQGDSADARYECSVMYRAMVAAYLSQPEQPAPAAVGESADLREALERIRQLDLVTVCGGTEDQYYTDGPIGKIASAALSRLKE